MNEWMNEWMNEHDVSLRYSTSGKRRALFYSHLLELKSTHVVLILVKWWLDCINWSQSLFLCLFCKQNSFKHVNYMIKHVHMPYQIVTFWPLKWNGCLVVNASASQPVDHGFVLHSGDRVLHSGDRVTTMFLHMTPVLVGSMKRTRKWLI
jgi:hypothetical protein